MENHTFVDYLKLLYGSNPYIDNDLFNQKINFFIEKYGYLLDENEKSNLNLSVFLPFDSRCSLLNQIYSFVDLTDNTNDPYIVFTNYIEETFGLDKNIVDLACGGFPSLSRRINEKQLKLGKGSICGIDRALKFMNFKNIKLYRKNITESTKLPKSDLLISFWPCESSKLFIDLGVKNNKEFSFVICDCEHKYNDQSSSNYKEYLYNYLNGIANNDFNVLTKWLYVNPYYYDDKQIFGDDYNKNDIFVLSYKKKQ